MQTKLRSGNDYTTHDELAFISIIGTGVLWPVKGMLERKDALRNYKKVLSRRHNWEGLDREKIFAAIDEALTGF